MVVAPGFPGVAVEVVAVPDVPGVPVMTGLISLGTEALFVEPLGVEDVAPELVPGLGSSAPLGVFAAVAP